MNRLLNKLKESKGFTFPSSIALLLLCLVLASFLMLYLQTFSTMTIIKNQIRQAVVQTGEHNLYNSYNGVREGNSAAMAYAGSGYWNQMVSTSEVTQRLKTNLNLEQRSGALYKYHNNVLRYAVDDMSVHCTNVSIGSDNTATLTFTTTATLVMPLFFDGSSLTVRVPVKFTSHFTPRY